MTLHAHNITHRHVHLHGLAVAVDYESVIEHTHEHTHKINHDHNNAYDGHRFHVNGSAAFHVHNHEHAEELAGTDHVVENRTQTWPREQQPEPVAASEPV